jgi:hypothetical protein
VTIGPRPSVSDTSFAVHRPSTALYPPAANHRARYNTNRSTHLPTAAARRERPAIEMRLLMPNSLKREARDRVCPRQLLSAYRFHPDLFGTSGTSSRLRRDAISLPRVGMKSRNSTLADRPDGHLQLLAPLHTVTGNESRPWTGMLIICPVLLLNWSMRRWRACSSFAWSCG